MIDGVKAILKDNLDAIRSALDFKIPTESDVKTGEIDEIGKFSYAKYKSLIFEDKGSIIEVRGSIHKLHNQGKHNYNRFGLSEIFLVLYELADVLKIDLSLTRLSNLEFGVNLIVDFEPKKFLASLIFHKGKIFTWEIQNNKQYRECAHIQYYIKIYDKGLQNVLNRYVLRIELKFVKMEKINGFGIKYLSDLLNPRKLEKLKNELLRVYDEILIGDLDGNTEDLKEKDKTFLANGLNGNYWLLKLPIVADYEYGNSDKSYKRDIKKFQRKIIKFKKLLVLTGSNIRALQIRKRIEKECDFLIQETERRTNSLKKCPELTAVKQQNSLKKCPELTTKKSDSKIDKVSRIDSLLYRDNKGQNKRYCIKTGLDISMQKENSRFLCTTGLKYYKENCPDLWLKLWGRLDTKWHGCSEEVQMREIHHSIRNEYFNKIHNTRRSIEKVTNHPSLFNQLGLISEEKLRIAGLAS